MSPHKVDRARVKQLTDLPNVGKATACDLRLLGFHSPEQLVGKCPFAMYERLCRKTGHRHDPCVIDVFMSVTRFMEGEPPRPWWEFTETRKNLLAGGATKRSLLTPRSLSCVRPLPANRIQSPTRKFFTMDIPRIFNITESAHRIHNPFTPDKFATLGTALHLKPGARVLDLGSGSGEMLCMWARDHGIVGTGIDMSQLFTEQAKLRAVELGVADQVGFIHGDAAGYVSDEKVDVAACVGATWIAGGVAGTIGLLARSLRTGGIILIGEPYWRQLPPTEAIAKRCLANAASDFLALPELISSFGNLGYDVVEMVLANQDGWDRYEAAKWLTMRRWLEANPDDELAKEVRAQLTTEPARHVAYTREYLGWGVFALMPR